MSGIERGREKGGRDIKCTCTRTLCTYRLCDMVNVGVACTDVEMANLLSLFTTDITTS